MDCREASVFMQLAEDQEIAKEEQDLLDSHLSACLACRRMSAWLNALEESYPAPDTLGDDFADAVVMQLTNERFFEIVAAETDIASVTAAPKPREKHFWLGRLWSLVTWPGRKLAVQEKKPGWLTSLAGSLWSRVARRGRKPVTPEKVPGWSSNVADSMAYGFKSLRPALAPAVVGQSYATGWLRIAGSNLSGRPRLAG